MTFSENCDSFYETFLPQMLPILRQSFHIQTRSSIRVMSGYSRDVDVRLDTSIQLLTVGQSY